VAVVGGVGARDGSGVEPVVGLGDAAFAQPLGDVLERVGEVAVVVERVDEDEHGGGVGRRQAHAAKLASQVILQALRGGVAVAAIELVTVVVGTRLARRFADAVEVFAFGAVLPVFAFGAAEVGSAVDRGDVVATAVAGAVGAGLGGAFALAFTGPLGAREAFRQRLECRRRFFLGLEKRVLLEHLLDFLVQLERRQLQQPDRLLKLWRQRQVLTESDLKRLLHSAPTLPAVAAPRGGAVRLGSGPAAGRSR
jgi:hypothetical protein